MTDQMPAQDLEALSAELLEKARGAHSGRAAKGVFAGTYLRQALLTLREGAELAEHDSPPEATLHVVKGQVRMVTADESWELSAGELIAIPPQKHSVEALTDAAFLLTIRTEVDKGDRLRAPPRPGRTWKGIPCSRDALGVAQRDSEPRPLGKRDALAN